MTGTLSSAGLVAVALRGDRGSQRLRRPACCCPRRSGGRPPGRPRIATRRWSGRSRLRRRGGRPPGRPRIATCPWTESAPAARQWRSPSGATEDRNISRATPSVVCVGWRSPSGATEDRNHPSSSTRRSARRWRSPSGATEDRNTRCSGRHLSRRRVAVALRGDRGSQPLPRGPRLHPHRRGGRPPGRPRIATRPGSPPWPGAARWRSPSGATEDRNAGGDHGVDGLLWRSPSGATEDRNAASSSSSRADSDVAVTLRGDRGSQQHLLDERGVRGAVAVALRGDRGSQRAGPRAVGERRRVAVTLRGDRGSQRRPRRPVPHPLQRGGRPPGRPRIATRRPSPPLRRPCRWRSPSGATEDRNVVGLAADLVDAVWRSPSGATEDRNAMCSRSWPASSGVAVALRGDRGSQPMDRRHSTGHSAGGGRPPGRPRIATGGTARQRGPLRGVAVALRGDRGLVTFDLAAPPEIIGEVTKAWPAPTPTARTPSCPAVPAPGSM